jgi:thermitase
VSGLIGLLKAVRPELTTAEVYKILHDTGTRVPDERKTGRMVQALPALERVLD